MINKQVAICLRMINTVGGGKENWSKVRGIDGKAGGKKIKATWSFTEKVKICLRLEEVRELGIEIPKPLEYSMERKG